MTNDLLSHAAEEMKNQEFEVPEESKLQQRFNLYHQKYPHVFSLFKKFAKDTKSRGRKYFGAKAIMERVRWSVNFETNEYDEFKINNNYTSRYVRLLERDDSSFKGFFKKRELRA